MIAMTFWSTFDQLQHRQIKPLHEDIGRIRPEPDAADVHQMAGAGEQRDGPAVLEGRGGHDEVVEVAGSHPGIVGDVGVAFLHGLDREVSQEVLHRLRHRIDVARRAGDALRQHPAREIEDAGGDVPAFAHDRREGRSHQDLALLLHHRDQTVPHDLEIDQAAMGPAHGRSPQAALRSMTMQPAPSIWASKLIETKVEVSFSAMMAGPATVAPGAIVSRR
jgi:hypothetical protein